ncbi:HAD family hydrolase [Stenotrophomonas panacihumi]|uniref:HAD family hydrolase n=1 Tax=Stenotrophomonas panacihumi TaxID=676599 RepID=A0A0R0B1N6_9GAMM|nr:HAD-IA family hydrolase [Stenotrophomonas panacihumi]KRG47681.1 HAD family hydrolase [Stenotrophomonas panacihumi]PTN54281.1 HAD family hydrolase [Stenotrophomonas panacihumi]
MSFPIRAITLDLDDTLWPFAPIGARIDRVLHEWMQVHSPVTAAHFDVDGMRELRERSFVDNPDLHHDLSALRRLTLQQAFELSGGDLALVEPAYEVFYAARNQVECYPDALDALARIAARVPVAALSNGNADLVRIGLDHHFAFQLGSREHGAAKPQASIFHAACARLDVPPAQVLHVGDHVDMDVVGALDAGLRACWINRTEATWPHAHKVPDLEFDTLAGLADWLDAQAAHAA